MERLTVAPIACRIFRAGEDLADYAIAHVAPPAEGAVLAVTSKIASLAERRLVPRASIGKNELVRREADRFLAKTRYGVTLTIKHGLLIPNAGIDESNSENGDYILYPERPFETAAKLWSALRDRWKLRNLGIVLTDSHVAPLRRGTVGIALAHWGFQGVRDMIGAPDLFGRPLALTQMNLADGIAAMATLAMGEGGEGMPLALVTGADLTFVEGPVGPEISMPLDQDLYGEWFASRLDSRGPEGAPKK